MARPVDWEPLAASDPIPGDPVNVGYLAKHLRDTADMIDRQVSALKNLCTDQFWDSDAGRKFRSTATDTANKLEKTYARYDAAASAVSGYGPELDTAQQMSLQPRIDAQNAQTDHERASKALANMPADTAHDDPDAVAHRNAQTAADGALTRARVALQRAIDHRDQAARSAAGTISTAMDNDGLTDSGWDKFKNWVHDNAGWITKIADIAGWIATACGIAALLVGWIPVIGQALAAVLTAVALVATIVSLVCHVVLALAGEGSWLDVGLDVVGLLTFGVGRAATSGARAAVNGLRASAKFTAVGERVGAKFGGTLGGDGLRALSAGQFGRVGSELGSTRNLVRGAVGNEWGAVTTELGGAGQRVTRAAMDAAPRSAWPGLSRIAEGFNPKNVVTETKDALTSVASTQSWRDSVQALRNGARPTDLDLDLAKDLGGLKNIRPNLLQSPLSEPFRLAVNANVTTFRVATLGGMGIDGLDKAHVFDPLK